MAKFMVCSVYDRVGDSYSVPLQLYRSDALAIRDVRAITLDERTQFFRSAGDYSLWHVADFDDDNGVIVAVERRLICNFDAVKGD